MLTRDQIQTASDLKVITVPVPEWGGDVGVRMMTGAERDTLLKAASASGKFDAGVYTTTMVALTMCDDTGKRLYQDDEGVLLSGKAGAALQRVFVAASKLNELGANAVDAAEKNLPADPSAASS